MGNGLDKINVLIAIRAQLGTNLLPITAFPITAFPITHYLFPITHNVFGLFGLLVLSKTYEKAFKFGRLIYAVF